MLLSIKPWELGFKRATWNFLEAGHGKGIPDAVGGSLKRKARDLVKFGTSLMSADDFTTELSKNSEVFITQISQEEISNVYADMKKYSEPTTVQGTMKIHQVYASSESPEVIHHREVSCTCQSIPCHDGHRLKRFDFKEPNCDEPPQDSQQPLEEKCGEHLSSLRECDTFAKLKRMASKIVLPDIDIDNSNRQAKLTDKIDKMALQNLPSGIDKNMIPVESISNGNCLPSSASKFAHGSLLHVNELRLRIAIELIINENSYLNNKLLKRGLDQDSVLNKSMLTYHYAKRADDYVPGSVMNRKSVQDLFRKEVFNILEDCAFMGIWQLHSLANIFRCPIMSVYPEKGENEHQTLFRRLILPFSDSVLEPLPILWTSNRSDMTDRNWLPNHFVPLLNKLSMHDDNGVDNIDMDSSLEY